MFPSHDPAAGTVGGINRATYSFWRNQTYDATTDGGTAASASNILAYMDTVYRSCSRNNDQPDLIVADDNYYGFFWNALQAQQRFTQSEMADAGFNALKFNGADVVFDGGLNGNCPSNHMYFLNTKYICLRPHKDRNFVPLDPDRFAVNQDAMVKLIGWAGNMTLSNASLQGVLKD